MRKPEAIKKLVRERYGKIVTQSGRPSGSSCCGSESCCSDGVGAVISEDYSKLDGYAAEADLGLGCGTPTAFAGIGKGHTVVDLGAGAGNDAFVARRLVGETGRVFGIDMTEAMIEKARQNNEKLGFKNVEFRLGDIEQMPLEDNVADVVISNCMLNLVPDKGRAFREIFRILKPGGNFCISDVVRKGDLPKSITSASEMYVGCVAGAMERDEYLSIIKDSGFTAVSVVKEKDISIPDDILSQYLKPSEMREFKRGGASIQSITVYARKPGR